MSGNVETQSCLHKQDFMLCLYNISLCGGTLLSTAVIKCSAEMLMLPHYG